MEKIKNLLKGPAKGFFSFTLSPVSGASRRGQMALTMVLTTLMFLILMVPVIEKFVQNEGKWSMKNRKTTLAFNLAESGVDRAYWKIFENLDNWDTIVNGGSIAGYANDTEYMDIKGGSYRINISSGSNIREIIIIGTGKDFSSKEYRAVKVVYSKEGIQAALQAPVIGGGGNANIHWGPIMSLSSIKLKAGFNQLYPRKYARTFIDATGGSYPDRDTDIATVPNYGPQAAPYTEWWSYDEPPSVPDVLTPDTSYYRQLAIAQGYYWPAAGTENEGNIQDNICVVGADPKVRFFEESVKFTGTKYFCGVIIALGTIEFVSGGHASGKISVSPPVEAWKEYQLNTPSRSNASEGGTMDTWDFSDTTDAYGDTAVVDEYPGDSGYHTSTGCYNFYYGRDINCDGDGADAGEGGLGGVSKNELSFKGYIYAGTGFTGSGGTRIFGSVSVAVGGGFSGGGCDIFYDDTLDIKTVNNAISRVSWHEVTPVEF